VSSPGKRLCVAVPTQRRVRHSDLDILRPLARRLEELDFETEARNVADLTQAVRRHEMVTVPASVALLTPAPACW